MSIRDAAELQKFLHYLEGWPEMQREAIEAFREEEIRRAAERKPLLWKDIPPSERRAWLDQLISSPRLTGWERQFITGLAERRRLSEKQVSIIDRCLNKLEEAGRC